MAKFVDRDILIKQINQVSSRTKNELKGLKGEIEVGDLLAKHLPDDTYVISQPMLGKYEPDFLVISPRYGFRLIEVKNWSVDYLQNVHSNGVFIIGNKSHNPLQQVRKHVEDLKGYLISNHPYLSDPHKLIGYVTIQYGFNKSSLDKFIVDWDEKNSIDFFTFHLFKDELTPQLDKKLTFSTKFRNIGLQEEFIEDIVKNIRVSQDEISKDEINILIHSEDIGKTVQEMKNLTKQTQETINEQSNNVTSTKFKSSNPKQDEKSNFALTWVLYSLLILAVGTVMVAILLTNEENIAIAGWLIDCIAAL
jgi:hypothetical protein